MRSFALALAFVSLLPTLGFAAGSASVGSSASPAKPTYDFPYESPYLSSLTARLVGSARTDFRFLELEGLPGRQSVPLLEERERLEITVLAQSAPAPVVFVIPGFGGVNRDGQTLFLAEQFHKMGHSVIIVPSPSNWKFVLSQNSVPLPGYTPAEVEDLARVLKQASALAAAKAGVQATSYSVAGYSLGGLHAGFLALRDQRTREFNFRRVLMINPPLDVAYAIEALDRMHDGGATWTRAEKDLLWGFALTLGQELLERLKNGENVLMNLTQYLRFSDQQIAFLIGESFRGSLAESIFTSQQIEDLKILKTPATRHQITARMSEAMRFGFVRYSREVVHPFWSRRLGRNSSYEEFMAEGRLVSHAGALARMRNVYMVHNQDDFVTRPADLNRMAQAMGSRAFIYSRGGHLGNLWYPQNVRDLHAIMGRLN